MFLTGELDPVRRFMPAEAMHGWVTDLRAEIVVPGAGHWVQQQAPEAVNAALLEFSTPSERTRGLRCGVDGASRWAIQDSNLGPLPYQRSALTI